MLGSNNVEAPPPPVDLRKGAREDYQLPKCSDSTSGQCLEDYIYPPTAEMLVNLSVTEPASKQGLRIFAGLLLAGIGVFLFRKR